MHSLSASAGVRHPSVSLALALSVLASPLKIVVTAPAEVGALGEVLTQEGRWCSRWCPSVSTHSSAGDGFSGAGSQASAHHHHGGCSWQGARDSIHTFGR
jgi:hypothetical protein